MIKVPRKIKKQIPNGRYCYTFTGIGFETKVCPMFFVNKLGCGDCKLLSKIDGRLNGQDDDLDFCLDDQCKSCGIKKTY